MTAMTLPAILSLALCAVSACAQSPLPVLELTSAAPTPVPGAGITLQLLGITDQRCPAGAQCFWEGMVRAEIRVLGPTKTPETMILCNRCSDGTNNITVAGLILTLGELRPSMEDFAKLGRDPVLGDYTLSISYGPAQP